VRRFLGTRSLGISFAIVITRSRGSDQRRPGWESTRCLPRRRSPWQNAYAERVIGSIRRECLDHVIVVNETGLSRLLTRYLTYYHQSRTHLSLDKDSPEPRPIAPPTCGPVVVSPQVGGLHHRYDRRAA